MASAFRVLLKDKDEEKLFSLFQKGVEVQVGTGCSLRSLLTDQWGLSEAVVAERISTVFLDGKPVDDFETAVIKPGAVLALSSAMPGLVGAVMRKGGVLGSLREDITYHESGAPVKASSGWITVKLFNLLCREIGPFLSRIGFQAKAGDLYPLLPEAFPEPPPDSAFRVFVVRDTSIIR